MGRRNPWGYVDQMWRVGRYGKRNHVCNIWWLSVKGCGCSKRGNFTFSRWLEVSPLQQWSPCDRVIHLCVARRRLLIARDGRRISVITCISPSNCWRHATVQQWFLALITAGLIRWQSQILVENRDVCPSYRKPPSEYRRNVWYETVEDNYVYWFWPEHDGRIDGHTYGQTPGDGIGRGYA